MCDLGGLIFSSLAGIQSSAERIGPVDVTAGPVPLQRDDERPALFEHVSRGEQAL